MTGLPLDPDRGTMEQLGARMVERAIGRLQRVAARPANVHAGADPDLVRSLLAPPPAQGVPFGEAVDRLERAADVALESSGPGNLAYIPGSGLFTAALAELYVRTVNRHGGLAAAAAGFTAIEAGVVSWFARDVCGLPEGSGGLLTSGGSMANFSATVAARHSRLGDDHARGAVYTTAFAHHSVAKAARLAGIRPANIRITAHTPDLRMDPAAARALIESDRRAGLRPFLLVATAGTTDTGTIDPLPQLAGLAAEQDLWFHVDAAYGGFFRLTGRGRERLAGIERADSVTLDPHKSLFMPFGTGALAVRDPGLLSQAHGGSGSYLRDLGTGDDLPNWSELGPELTRENRGVRVWLPLQLHGVDRFGQALDDKLDQAGHVHAALAGIPELEVPLTPDLTTVVFRVRADGTRPGDSERADQASARLLERVNASGRIVLSSTTIDGRPLLRLTALSHRTDQRIIETALDLIRAESSRAGSVR